MSKSGKELKKLLGKANGMNESDAEDDDEDEEVRMHLFGCQVQLFSFSSQ